MKRIQFLLFIFLSVNAFAQDEGTNEEQITNTVQDGIQGFHFGFYVGAFFANNYAASLYDGYGLDTSANRNIFINSTLVQRMIVNGMDSANCSAVHSSVANNDVISPALGLDHDQWRFDSTDMPTGLKYNVAFQFGLNFQYGFNKSEGIILNANFCKLNVTGTFSIERQKTFNSALGDSILFFGISGQEQRFMFQLGYSKMFGPPDVFNVLVEAGLLMNSVKYLKNEADINGLKLDLTPFSYNLGAQNNYLPSGYNNIGFGAFAGVGFNLNFNSKYIMQILYSPSYEKINTGAVPTAKLQQSAGLRAYINF